MELPGDLADAWVAPAEDGAICTYIPDPVGGYGASCATQEDLMAGGAITVLGGTGELRDQAVVVVVVPDGGDAPVVTDPSGTEETPAIEGIGATVVSEESSVSVGDVSLTIPAFEPVCEAAVDAEFRRSAF